MTCAVEAVPHVTVWTDTTEATDEVGALSQRVTAGDIPSTLVNICNIIDSNAATSTRSPDLTLATPPFTLFLHSGDGGCQDTSFEL